MQVKTAVLFVAIFLIAIAVSSLIVFAQPQGPEGLFEGTDERKPTADPIMVQAQAGNVTALSINATRITSRWQGYYGNISGSITLDDAQNNSIYQWQLVSPQGEIYAVNDSKTVQWTQVICVNISALSANAVNVTLSALETSLGMSTNDADGVNETFNHTFTGSFQVGTRTINSASGCRSVSLYQNDGYTGDKFNETILTDNTSNHNVIYTALLEQDATGFSGSTLDFQMLVGENGDTEQATNYYFYVELT